MRAYDLIRKKRDGGTLTPAELRFLVQGAATGDVADEQLSAFLMAVFFRGMDLREELPAWLEAMLRLGRRARSLGDRRAGRSTSTPPAASATRSRFRSRRWSRPAACRCRWSPAAASATPAARSTSWRHPRLPRRPRRSTRFGGWWREVGVCLIGQTARDRARGPQALRAARRHRHGGVDPAHRRQHPLQEARRGDRRAGARRQGRRGAFMKTLEDARALARTHGRAGGRGRPRRASPSSPTWTRRSAAPSATPSRSRESIDVLHGSGPADCAS